MRKPCKRCDKIYLPKTRGGRICDKCNKNLNGTRKSLKGIPKNKKYYFDENDYLTEVQSKKVKYKTVYKKGRCHSQKRNLK